jgi:hypothetical protein
MPSPEGSGTARSTWQRAWDQYANAVNRVARPVMEPALKPVARELTFELMGFWLAWHLEGGFEGLHDPEKLGMSRSAIYRRVTLFRRVTGQHPDDYRMPGVSLAVHDYIEAAAKAAAEEGDSPA